jgi:hypothetical protein
VFPKLVRASFQTLLAKERLLVPEVGVKELAAKRQEGGQQDL